MLFQKGKPNIRLRDERLRRHWSQQELADLIGATLNTVSRWERGLTDCSPYFRNKLCELFGKDARQLWLVPDLEAESKPALYDPFLPGMKKVVGRGELLDHLREKLCGYQEGGILALTGMPGVGKSALAVALVHDVKIKERFYEGILWVDAGPQPDVLSVLSHWGTLLGVELPRSGDGSVSDAWLPHLRKAIGTRRLLIILDNVWRLADAIVLLHAGGPYCTYLITTRSINIALYTAGEQMLTVPELSTEDGLCLLARLVPAVVEAEPQRSRRLVQLVGGLPLALMLIGQYLRLEAHHRQPRRLCLALEWLYAPEHRLQLEQPRVTLDHSATYSTLSLQNVIAWSERQLEEQTRAALRLLSVFPTRPNTFSEQAALAVTEAPVEVFDQLCDAGLLESREPGRYSLHRCIADYAALYADKQLAERRFIAHCVAHLTPDQREYQWFGQEQINLFAALLFAYKHRLHTEQEQLIATFSLYRSLWKQHDQLHDILTSILPYLKITEDFEILSEVLRLLDEIEPLSGERCAFAAHTIYAEEAVTGMRCAV